LEEITTIGLAYRLQINETSVMPGAWHITENALRREHMDEKKNPLPSRISHIGGETRERVNFRISQASPN